MAAHFNYGKLSKVLPNPFGTNKEWFWFFESSYFNHRFEKDVSEVEMFDTLDGYDWELVCFAHNSFWFRRPTTSP